MPKIRCDCDNVIWFGEIPSPHQLMIISEADYTKHEDNMDILYSEMNIVLKCPECERLHIFWEGTDKPWSTYKREA